MASLAPPRPEVRSKAYTAAGKVRDGERGARPLPPLPHPSWEGRSERPSGSLGPGEFWERLGL